MSSPNPFLDNAQPSTIPQQPVQFQQPQGVPTELTQQGIPQQPVQFQQPQGVPTELTQQGIPQQPVQYQQVPVASVEQPVQYQQPQVTNIEQPIIPPTVTAAVESVYAPKVEAGQTVLCRLTPGKYDAFIQVLNLLDDKSAIIIHDSNICQKINNSTAILMTDISQLVETKLNLHILNPKKSIKRLKAIKSNSDIFIIEDSAKYIVTNEDIQLFLPKQTEGLEESQPPNLSDAVLIGEGQKIEKAWKTIVLANIDESSPSINILVHQNQMKGISIPELANIPFPAYKKEGINENNADLKLKSFSFLKVPGEDIVISLLYCRDSYWLHTHINTGLCSIHIVEILTISTDDTLELV